MLSSRGLPSSGCSKCRSRKVKCDETKPTCEKCIKIGHSACVYRDEIERTWQNQTEHIAETAQRKWKARSKKPLEDQLQNLHVTGSDPNTSGSQSEPSSSVSPDSSVTTIEEKIMERFFFDWVIEEQFEADKSSDRIVPRRSVGFLQFLPIMFHAARAKPKSVLAESVTALAFANYGQRLKYPEALNRALESYCAALNLLKQIIFNPALARKDETLVSISLLDFNLAFLYWILDRSFRWGSHPADREMFAKLKSENSRRAMRTTIQSSGSSNYDLFDEIYKTAELLARLKDALQDFDDSSPSSIEQVVDILDEAFPLDTSLEKWARDAPPDASYAVVPFNKDTQPEWLWSLLANSWRPRAAHTYPSLLAELKWRFHWTTRLVLNQAILKSITLLELAWLESTIPINRLLRRKETEFNIVGLVDQLCESCLTPFLSPLLSKPKAESILEFCSARGYMLLAPLPVVKLCLDQTLMQDFDLQGRKQWVQAALSLLEHEVGYAKAGAVIPPAHNHKIEVQLWALIGEN